LPRRGGASAGALDPATPTPRPAAQCSAARHPRGAMAKQLRPTWKCLCGTPNAEQGLTAPLGASFVLGQAVWRVTSCQPCAGCSLRAVLPRASLVHVCMTSFPSRVRRACRASPQQAQGSRRSAADTDGRGTGARHRPELRWPHCRQGRARGARTRKVTGAPSQPRNTRPRNGRPSGSLPLSTCHARPHPVCFICGSRPQERSPDMSPWRSSAGAWSC